ncbi:hypothetical protein C0Z18_26700 [Trinickia dabaoshanensis]|uniref:Uncharacterized protein n=1 Tax=Trinickia dabaoshanensis TaxID=564714 RepID=A0A2N7VEN1_9BURK|nr:hypothetical protein [Trinickia dabaoshanensis]PMS15607.1 hypothetical protein C0Z18_26700 [Trinickia dabaoshanensis]
MKKWLAVLLTVSVLAACNKNDGKEYLGVWKKVRGRGPDVVTVQRNGDQFIVSNGGFFPGKHPAELKNDALVIHWDEMSADLFVIDKKTGHLVGGAMELAR